MADTRGTILDAVEAVLNSAREPKSAAEILSAIRERGLYDFKAKDPVGVLRAAIRKHLKGGGVRVRVVSPDRYASASKA